MSPFHFDDRSKQELRDLIVGMSLKHEVMCRANAPDLLRVVWASSISLIYALLDEKSERPEINKTADSVKANLERCYWEGRAINAQDRANDN